MRVASGGRGFVHITDIEHRLRGQKLQVAPGARILGRDLGGAGRLAFVQQRLRTLEQPLLLDSFLVATPDPA